MNTLFTTDSSQPLVTYPSLGSFARPSSPPRRTCSPQSFVDVELVPLSKMDRDEEQERNPGDPTPEEEREKNRIEALVAFYAGIYADLSLSKQINAGLLAFLVLIEWAIFSAVK